MNTPVREALERFGRQGTVDPELRALVADALARAPRLYQARASADVLSVGLERRPAAEQPLWGEALRNQVEFNHALVDLVEAWPWLTLENRRVVLGGLDRQARHEWNPPRKPGARGFAVSSLKVLAGPVVGVLLRATFEELTRANAEVLRSLRDDYPGGPAIEGAGRALRVRGGASGPFCQAQASFLVALARSLELTLRAGQAPPADAPTGAVSLRPAVSGTGPIVIRLGAAEGFTKEGARHLIDAFSTPSVMAAFGDAWLDGRRVFRPSYGRESLWQTNVIGETFAVRASLVEARKLTAASEPLEWLLAEGLDERTVARIPEVVTVGKRVAETAAAGAIVQQAISPTVHATVTQNDGSRTVRLRSTRRPLVSVIVPFRDAPELLEGLWRSLDQHRAGAEFELVLASNQSREGRTFRLLDSLSGNRNVRWFEWNQPFNYSAINNAAVHRAQGDLLLFLNNDIEVRHDDWLADLVGYAELAEVGAVGARLLYQDGSLQHAGVALGFRGLAGHFFARWRPEFGSTPFGWPGTRNWTAVTGACLLMRREVFHDVGGFDERMVVSGSDIELCCRVRARGLRVVCVGHVELTHFESQSRGRTPPSLDDLRRELLAFLPMIEAGDPYAHPGLCRHGLTGYGALEPEDGLSFALRSIAGRLVAASR
ncbi:MAG: glycosyltransferase [Myxococcaceae bacterium]|nr:glycosyltransferase [Myxococcaceae bacterium]